MRPGRLPPNFLPEAGPTPASATLSPQVSRTLCSTAPQLPTGRIEQVPLRARASADTRPCSRGGLFAATAPRCRQKIRLITPSWGGRTNQSQTKTPTENPEAPKFLRLNTTGCIGFSKDPRSNKP